MCVVFALFAALQLQLGVSNNTNVEAEQTHALLATEPRVVAQPSNRIACLL
jgi:hypothetical protein